MTSFPATSYEQWSWPAHKAGAGGKRWPSGLSIRISPSSSVQCTKRRIIILQSHNIHFFGKKNFCTMRVPPAPFRRLKCRASSSPLVTIYGHMANHFSLHQILNRKYAAAHVEMPFYVRAELEKLWNKVEIFGKANSICIIFSRRVHKAYVVIYKCKKIAKFSRFQSTCTQGTVFYGNQASCGNFENSNQDCRILIRGLRAEVGSFST